MRCSAVPHSALVLLKHEAWTLELLPYERLDYAIILGYLRSTKFCWVGKHVNIFHETDELPNPRPTQPRKTRLKVTFWATFSHGNFFFVGRDWFYIGNRPQETQPNRNSPQIPHYEQKSVSKTVLTMPSIEGVRRTEYLHRISQNKQKLK